MIVPVFGPPGAGKTTILREVSSRHGTPYFELSWMPEFRRMNGMAIDYSADETIAIGALLAVAKAYVSGGHRVVFVSDFRLECCPLVLAQLNDVPHQVVRLICSDSNVLSARVLDPDRPSGYRDVAEAVQANDVYCSMQADDHIVIDVTEAGVEDVIRVLEDRVLLPNNAINADK